MEKILESTDMNDIEKALKEEDYCQAMSDIGFKLMFFDDEYPDDFLFIADDDLLIVLYRKDILQFWTYPRANNRVVVKPQIPL